MSFFQCTLCKENWEGNDKKHFCKIKEITKEPIKLNLGCGNKQIKSFINIDGRKEVNPDVVMDITKISSVFENVDLIYTCHVLEHFPYKPLSFSSITVKEVIEDWYKALKIGGELRISVPDFQAIAEHYFIHKDLNPLRAFLVGGQKYDFDQHYSVWDFNSLSKLLKEVGFQYVELYDWKKTEHSYCDDYSQSYLPHMDKINGKMMSLNVKGIK